ncbi:MAG: heavy-metal-associated domain-containing protein [Chloroflexota bacterium]
MIEQTFRVYGLHCTNCVMNLESLEDSLPGVERICASYKQEQMVVRYDPARLTVAQILAAVAAKGYQAELARP